MCPSDISLSRKPNLQLSLSGLIPYIEGQTEPTKILRLVSLLTGACEKWNEDAKVSILSPKCVLVIVLCGVSADFC